MRKQKVVIIGAGPGGLSSAMLLASQGFDVELLEKDGVPGGRNKMLKLGDFSFDTGPTFLLMKFYLDKIFELAGRRAEDYLKFEKLEPMYRLVFKDREVNIFSDPDRMRQELSEKFPGSRADLDRFLKKEEERFWKIYPCLQKDYGSILRYFHSDFIKALPHLSLGRSIWKVLGDYFGPDEMRLSFTFQSKYLGMSAWECPGAFSIIPFAEHKFGIYHVEGGLNSISSAMSKAAGELGAKLRFSAPVKSLLVQGKTVVGVKLLDGEEISADVVVCNPDFAYAMSELVPEGKLKKYAPQRLKKKRYSCSTFMLYLGLDKQYALPHHNIFFADDYRRNVDEVFRKGMPSEDMSFYIQNASATDPTLASAGQSTIYVLVPVPNKAFFKEWGPIKDDYRRKVIDRIEARTEMKDLRAHIIEEKIITPDEWESDYNVYQGATFNLAHNLGQMLTMRPHNEFEELENLYLVGGGTHPGSGLPTIYESARISSDLIARRFRKNKHSSFSSAFTA